MKSFRHWIALAVVFVMVASVGIPQFGNVWAADTDGAADQATAPNATVSEESKKEKSKNEESEPELQPADNTDDSVNQTVEEEGAELVKAEKTIAVAALSEGSTAGVKSVDPQEEQRQIHVTFSNGSSVVDEQMVIIKEGKVTKDLNLPGTPDGSDNQKFNGWFDENGNKLIEPSKDLNGFLSAVGTDDKIAFTARYSEIYYAYFMSSDRDDANIVHTESVDTKDGEISMYTGYTPANARVSKWKDKATGTVYELNQKAKISSDTVFVPVIVECYWVTFDTQGGSDIDSVYVMQGEACDLLTVPNPSRKGYTFRGWSTSKNGAILGNFFTPVKDTVLYAQWKPEEVKYQVVYWGENADDNDYSILAVEEKKALSGTEISFDANTAKLPASVSDRQHFTFKQSDKRFIASDGSTAINVYYSRNEYEIRFFQKKGVIITVNVEFFRVKAKYGSDIAYIWKKNPLKEYVDGGYLFKDNKTSAYYTFIAKMPKENLTLNAESTLGQVYSWDYYLEVLDNKPPAGATVVTDGGKQYYLYHTVKTKSILSPTLNFDRDYVDITGFKQKYSTVPSFNNRKAKLFYDRRNYSLLLINYSDIKSISVPYGASIVDKGQIPSRPADVSDEAEFKGWYKESPAQVTEDMEAYDFSGKTMPANNQTFYSYWKEPPLTVRMDVELSSQQINKEFKVEPGKTIAGTPQYQELLQEIQDDGKELIRWVDVETGKTFDVNKPLSKGVHLYAVLSGEKYTVSYDITTNGGSGTAPVDSNSYAAGTKAKVKKFSGNTPGDMFFKKWKCDDGTDYYPGDEVKVTKDLKMTAVYSPATEKIDLTYYANFKDKGSKASKTVKVFEGQNVKLADNDFGTPEGRSFVEWNTEADGSGDAYKAGSTVNVTRNGNNELYAQYKTNENKNGIPDKKDGSDKSGTSARTGDTAPIGAIAAMMLIAAIAAVFLLRRKRENQQ